MYFRKTNSLWPLGGAMIIGNKHYRKYSTFNSNGLFESLATRFSIYTHSVVLFCYVRSFSHVFILFPQVESLLTLPLSLACTSSSQGYTCFRQRGRYAYTLPVFRLPEHKVWGLTAMMTDSALSLLFPGSYRSAVSGSRSR